MHIRSSSADNKVRVGERSNFLSRSLNLSHCAVEQKSISRANIMEKEKITFVDVSDSQFSLHVDETIHYVSRQIIQRLL